MSSSDPTKNLVVAVNFTFDTSTGQATFSVIPEVGNMAYGDQNTITWWLTATDENGTAIPATFAYENGVYFKPPTAPGYSTWNGDPPTAVLTTQPYVPLAYQVTDYNTAHPRTYKYQYGVKVTYNGTTYDYDPEVDDDPPR